MGGTFDVLDRLAGLAQVIPPDLVRQVLRDTGRVNPRDGCLTHEVTCWGVLGMGLFTDLPLEKRPRDENGKPGILHVKCAVADGRWLFLSSANLTEYAFTINMELGLLVTGGNLPRQVQEHFDRLIEAGVLARV
jgi:hypothetical protein